MGRRKKDIKFEEALKRLIEVYKRRDFVESLDLFYDRWEKSGYPEILGRDRKKIFDKRRKRMVYYGLHYDLREICDIYELVWPIDGGLLMQILMMKKTGENNPTSLIPIDIPKNIYWQWFRLARSGLGISRTTDLENIDQNFPGLKITTQGKNRNLNSGFPYEAIAEINDVDERTVRNAIKACWGFIKVTSNLNFAISECELEGIEIVKFIVANMKRNAKPEK